MQQLEGLHTNLPPAHTRRKTKTDCALKSTPSHKPPSKVLIVIHANAWLDDTGVRVLAEGTAWAEVHFGSKGHLYTGYLDAANLV